MTYGKSVRIFLADGVATGIRHAEIVNWTGQALACPRSRFSELQNWPEVSRPGVYFLLVGPTGTSKGIAYIGESENVLVRARTQLKERDFWNEIVVFSSKDENLTKSHVKYLESRLIEEATSAKRFEVENSGGSNAASLPRADLAAMEEFLEHLRLVLGTLGYPLLESVSGDTSDASRRHIQASPMEIVTFHLSGKSYSALGRFVDQGFLLLEGSQLTLNPGSSMPGRIREMWDAAKVHRETVEQNGLLVTTRPILFGSPSYAASFVTGQARNGRKDWKAEDGRSLGEVEEHASEST